MAEKYCDLGSKQMRLHNTICLWDSKPVYVSTYCGYDRGSPLKEEEVIICDITAKKDPYLADGWQRVKYTDSKFNVAAFELGYANYKQDVVYLTRIPAREQQAGLTYDNFKTSTGSTNVLYTESLSNCVEGKYPSFNDALSNVRDEYHGGCAFHRSFAVKNAGRNRITLHFKEREIGVWNARSRCFRLHAARDNKLLSKRLDGLGVKHVIDED
jgi:hypothetical protein